VRERERKSEIEKDFAREVATMTDKIEFHLEGPTSSIRHNILSHRSMRGVAFNRVVGYDHYKYM